MSEHKEITRVIAISREEADRLKRLLETEPKSEEECFGEDETITKTADFDGGMEMDVKICGVRYEEGESNLPWTEAVLFDHGCEVRCTEPRDTFFGTWSMFYEDTVFTAMVIIV